MHSYSKRKYFSTVERNTPEYKLWRLAVYKRDEFKCKKCGLKMNWKGKQLNAHHIRPWADYPVLRYDINNGITLCYKCHKIMFQNEHAYVIMCMDLIADKNLLIKTRRLIS